MAKRNLISKLAASRKLMAKNKQQQHLAGRNDKRIAIFWPMKACSSLLQKFYIGKCLAYRKRLESYLLAV